MLRVVGETGRKCRLAQVSVADHPFQRSREVFSYESIVNSLK
jgi:hypothetical protein